jgi:phage terminase Nu1 subunit (DNA packaging protein)
VGVRAQVLEGQQVRLSREVAEEHPLPAAQAVRAQAQVVAAEAQEVMGEFPVLLAHRVAQPVAAVVAAATQGLAADPATPSMETAPALVLWSTQAQ